MAIYTNNNHRVHVIEGDAQGIIQRGQQIEDLGEQMIGAAGVLSAIADGASEEKGRSIERIRDEVGADWFEQHGRADQSRRLFESVALSDEFAEFLTLPAYEELEG